MQRIPDSGDENPPAFLRLEMLEQSHTAISISRTIDSEGTA